MALSRVRSFCGYALLPCAGRVPLAGVPPRRCSSSDFLSDHPPPKPPKTSIASLTFTFGIFSVFRLGSTRSRRIRAHSASCGSPGRANSNQIRRGLVGRYGPFLWAGTGAIHTPVGGFWGGVGVVCGGPRSEIQRSVARYLGQSTPPTFMESPLHRFVRHEPHRPERAR